MPKNKFNMIKAIALDDEPPALKIIEHFCSKIDTVILEKTFTQPKEALNYLKKYPVDLLFLDIQMPTLSGLGFFKMVNQDSLVIFTTAFSEYAVEGFNLNAVDYLLKPFTFDRFKTAVEKAETQLEYKKQIKKETPQSIFIRADYSLIKISLEDILYIEGLDDYIRIFQADNTQVVARMTMKAILEKLPSPDFIRVHRSYIVPFNRIDVVRNKTIYISEKDIPISKSYEVDFFRLFDKA
jgi:DNA-binding LytR/AlgR family response regulator